MALPPHYTLILAIMWSVSEPNRMGQCLETPTMILREGLKTLAYIGYVASSTTGILSAPDLVGVL